MPEEKTIGDDDQNKDLDFSEVLKDPKNKKKVNKKKNNSLEKSISKRLPRAPPNIKIR